MSFKGATYLKDALPLSFGLAGKLATSPMLHASVRAGRPVKACISLMLPGALPPFLDVSLLFLDASPSPLDVLPLPLDRSSLLRHYRVVCQQGSVRRLSDPRG